MSRAAHNMISGQSLTFERRPAGPLLDPNLPQSARPSVCSCGVAAIANCLAQLVVTGFDSYTTRLEFASKANASVIHLISCNKVVKPCCAFPTHVALAQHSKVYVATDRLNF